MHDDAVLSALAALAEAEDRRAGIRERFLTPTIGGGRTVALIATPLGEPRSMGWVVCHSFGMEQVNLATHEVPVARRLAAGGYPVLRYHGQGYGDSELPPDGVGLASHLRDALDAAAVLAEETGVREVGFFGARLGGTIGALAADRLGAAAFVAWEPIVRGTAYVRSLVKLAVMVRLMHQQQREGDVLDPEREFAERNRLDVQGFPLSRAAHDELTALELIDGLTSFRGRSLVVQVSKEAKPQPDLERLTRHLAVLGGQSELAIVTDERASTFAEPRYRPIGGGHKADTQERLGRSLVARTLEWCVGPGSPPASAGAA